jgi:hypothetical protein
MHRSGLVLSLGLASLALATPARADTVVLANGHSLSGKVVADDGERVTLVVADGTGRIVLPRASVLRVESEGPSTAPGRPVETPPVPAPGDSRKTEELEARLAALGPSREELLASVRPTPDEASELARLEAALDGGADASVKALAGKGRPALLVASRALASPSRARRSGAARVVAALAVDERALPFLLALDIPEKLLAAAADDDADSSGAARAALEAIARRPVAPEGADPSAELAAWRSWWQKEEAELAPWEQERDAERAALEAELVRRGRRRRPARLEVTLSANAGTALAPLPEPELVLPRLVLRPPTALTLGDDRALHLSFAVENRGPGPLELRPDDASHQRQRVLARYPGHAGLALGHERVVAAPFLRLELLDETFAPALGARAPGPITAALGDGQALEPAEPGKPAATTRVLPGISPGWASILEPAPIGASLVPAGVYWVVVGLEPGIETASSAEERVAATRIRLEDGRVTVLERLEGDAFLARRSAREGAVR